MYLINRKGKLRMAVELTASQIEALHDEMRGMGTVVLVQSDGGGGVTARTNIIEEEDRLFTLGESGDETEATASDAMEVEAAAKHRGLDPLRKGGFSDAFVRDILPNHPEIKTT